VIHIHYLSRKRTRLLNNLFFYFLFMGTWKITVLPDGTIKALDSNKQVYVYLPNVLCDEYGECPLFIEWNRSNRYCIFDLTNDPIADSAKKLRGRHGRTPVACQKEAIMASKLEGIWWFMKRTINKFHN